MSHSITTFTLKYFTAICKFIVFFFYYLFLLVSCSFYIQKTVDTVLHRILLVNDINSPCGCSSVLSTKDYKQTDGQPDNKSLQVSKTLSIVNELHRQRTEEWLGSLDYESFFLIVQIETTNLATALSSVRHLWNKRQSYWNQFLDSNGRHCHLLDCKKCSREEEKSRNNKAMPAAKWSLSVELPVLTPFRALQRKLRVLTECAECSWRVQCRYTISWPLTWSPGL